MFLDIVLIGFAFLLSIPTITAYFAYSHGRSFWLWFTIGVFLPILANFIIIILCWKDAIKMQKRDTAQLSRYEDEWMSNYIATTLNQKSSGKKSI